MDITILLYWLLFNCCYGIVEYPIYLHQTNKNSIISLGIRMLLFPLIKLICALLIVFYYMDYINDGEILIISCGLYFIGLIFNRGTLFQMIRCFSDDGDFHFFSHSTFGVLYLRNAMLIDVYALGATLITILGYMILFEDILK